MLTMAHGSSWQMVLVPNKQQNSPGLHPRHSFGLVVVVGMAVVVVGISRLQVPFKISWMPRSPGLPVSHVKNSE